MYKLELAYLNDGDLRADRPFLPEKDDADMYIRAFVEDIGNFQPVVRAELVDNYVLIELDEQAELSELQANLKSMDRKYYENFKTLSLAKHSS